ncbi:MAG: phosphate/phosphite/phosphonate ABC transporter substrate-binding protein [bacterium]
MFKRVILISLFLVTLFSTPVSSAEKHAIGVVPFYSPEKIWNLYSPMIDYLNKNTGITWELKLYRDHDAIIKGMCTGELSIALLGPVPFGRAREQCEIKPLLVSLGSDGKPAYRSVLITGNDTINSVRDLKGKKIGFFKGSTAAFVLPRKMLDDEGITLDAVQPTYFNSQDRIVEALIKREIDAAGIKQSLFERFQGSQFKILKVSEPLPNFVFCAPSSIDSSVAIAFVKTLRLLNPGSSPAGRKTVEGWDDEIKHGFIVPPTTYLQEAEKLLNWYKKYN